MLRQILLFSLLALFAWQAQAKLSVPPVFTNHMVLQRSQTNKVWGWDEPGSKIAVSFAGKKHETTSDEKGEWEVWLPASEANPQAQTLSIAGTSRIEITDVLVGEVWLCSGQSNMSWILRREVNGDLNGLASTNAHIRLLRVPKLGTQETQTSFEGSWQLCDPESSAQFSSVGYYFGRYLNHILDVPIGLIDNSWGGSSAEAWVRRDLLAQHPELSQVESGWQEREAFLQSPAGMKDYESKHAEWEATQAEAIAANKKAPREPRHPQSILAGNQRPGNIYNGMLHPILGYGIRGAIWYQGESNSRRAEAYRTLFPFLIQSWRDEWGQGDFPFYWVQLADYRSESPSPQESDWAVLRESQSDTLSLPNTGQAVIIDLGEAKDIHPRNKYEVASRLVRWALAKDYGYDIPHRSPEYKSVQFSADKAIVQFDCFGSSLKTFDKPEVMGFSICGEDRVWHWAEAQVVGDDVVELRADAVAKPIAVRYAWADNPICNLYSQEDLPVTPFRTDTFPTSSQ